MFTKSWLFAAAIPLAILMLGSLTTRTLIRDKVYVPKNSRHCLRDIDNSIDNPVERLAFALGGYSVVKADTASATVRPYTIFMIPLGYLRGTPDMTIGIFCSLISR